MFIPSYPKLWTKKDGRVKFHPKSVNSDENLFANKFGRLLPRLHHDPTTPPLVLWRGDHCTEGRHTGDHRRG